VNRFLVDDFLKILVDQSDLYYAHASRRDHVGRLSRDMKEHQLQVIVGVGKKK
jgi:hypothetical protein